MLSIYFIYARLIVIRLELRRNSLVVVPSGNGKEILYEYT